MAVEQRIPGSARELTMDEDFLRLLADWRAGSADAAGDLLGRYSERVRKAVRARLHRRLRVEYDSLDFVQDVWASLAALPLERVTFQDPDALIGFLVRVAEFKVIEATRKRLNTRKRDIRREESLRQNSDDTDAAVCSHEPSPSQLAIGEESWNQMLAALPEGHRIVLHYLREGVTHEQIAQMTGISLRSVERVVQRLKVTCGL